MTTSNKIGIDMPADFPTEAYDAVGDKIGFRVGGNIGAANLAYAFWTEYAAGWNAVGYRFRTAADADTAFTASIASVPTHEEYRIQEEALYAFFVTGYFAIESFAYALFAIGAMLKPKEFPMCTEEDLSKINPKRTTKKFKSEFPGTSIHKAISNLLVDSKFVEWGKFRNVLAHRQAPRRESAIHLAENVVTGAASTPWKTTWGVSPNLRLTLDDRTTADKRAWLARHLTELMEATKAFVTDEFR